MQQHLLPATRELSAAPVLQHSNPHAHPVPMLPWSMGPRYPSSPRRRVGELPQTVAAPSRAMSNPSNPKAPRARDVRWGLILDPTRSRRLRQLFPLVGRPGEAGRNLGRGGSGQRVGKWSCRWRWPGLWAAAGPRLGWGTNGKGEIIKLGRS